MQTVDLCRPLQGLDGVTDRAEIRVLVTFDGRPIGTVDIPNRHRPVSAARLREAIVDQFGLGLLGQDPERSPEALLESAKAALHRRYLPANDRMTVTSARLSDDVLVSVVVPTYDRPDDLRDCLRCLSAQESARPVEIVVVDNHPTSGQTPPVVDEFPGVVLVTETRRGLAYARNKGFTTSRGEILISVDDDRLAPPDWLEKLVAPFVWSDVMVVTGNTLPLELETTAQRSFERYGGLGRGFVPKEADIQWFNSFAHRAVPTWDLGTTANAAFRAKIFAHPGIGVMDEALGPGTPTGVGEDAYLFYKVLRAGYTIAYEPSAYVRHKYRREMHALRNQLYNYGKGRVAYHLTTLLRDHDRRAVAELTIRLPGLRLRQLASYAKRRLLRRSYYPLRLTLIEVVGNLAGPWGLWRSCRRVKREGRSDPYIPPVSQWAAIRGKTEPGGSSMIARMKVVDVELSAPPQPLEDVDGYHGLKAVVRLHGTPIGYVELSLFDTNLTAADLRRVILQRLTWSIIRHHLRDMVEDPLPPNRLSIEELLNVPHTAPGGVRPLITVAVCTRDRTEDLRLCLDALMRLDYPHLDIVVVDNAPSSGTTARLVKDSYPRVRYICEPKPGLDWARNRAIAEARGEIIAYTDDDVVVDSGWATALAAAFEDPEVMGVTGLIVPYELETEAQILFEQSASLDSGFERRYWRMDREGGERPLWYLGTGQYGAGANMAYRRSLFERVGHFDPALDVGTVTNGGGDLEMFFRVLKEGYQLVYEPAAMVRHRHRRDYAQLRVQLADFGTGFSSYIVRTALTYPDVRIDAVRFWLWWFWRGNLRRLIASFIRPSSFPRELIWAELWGTLVGLRRYPRAQRRAARIASSGDDAGSVNGVGFVAEAGCQEEGRPWAWCER